VIDWLCCCDFQDHELYEIIRHTDAIEEARKMYKEDFAPDKFGKRFDFAGSSTKFIAPLILHHQAFFTKELLHTQDGDGLTRLIKMIKGPSIKPKLLEFMLNCSPIDWTMNTNV